MTFAELMKEARKRQRIRQTELAAKIGVSQGYVSKIEKGRLEIGLRDALRIMKILEIDLEELAEISEESKENGENRENENV